MIKEYYNKHNFNNKFIDINTITMDSNLYLTYYNNRCVVRQFDELLCEYVLLDTNYKEDHFELIIYNNKLYVKFLLLNDSLYNLFDNDAVFNIENIYIVFNNNIKKQYKCNIQNLDNYTEFGFNISSIKIICGDCMEISDYNENIKKPLFIHDSEFISSYTKSKIKCNKCKKEDYIDNMQESPITSKENYYTCKECNLIKCELCFRKGIPGMIEGVYQRGKLINKCSRINEKECIRLQNNRK
jgi:hypothetical protein